MMHRTKIVKRRPVAKGSVWNPEEVAKAAAGLQSAALWACTTEGHDYWMEVYGKLCKAAGVEPFSSTVM